MAKLPITVLDEFYIKYRKIDSPIFRLNGILKSIKSYKLETLANLGEVLDKYDPLYVYTVLYEELDGKCLYILNAYVGGVEDEKFNFISENDTEFTLVQYVVYDQPETGTVVETIAVGNKSFKSAIETVIEVYKEHQDFKFCCELDDLLFKKIASY